jgi:2-amino-4,5-dihydroxy-6-oxo-7-(phosphonooxy)heptanoate synthase
MMSLIVHLSAGTSSGADPEAKTLVCSVGEALRLGADAVSVHINLGSATEQRQLADAARVSDLCDRWNLPLLAMIYIRGSRAEQAADPAALAHVTAVATDLGADMVKMGFAGTVEEMSEVVRSSSIPVLVAGGPARPASNEIDSTVRDAMRAGAHGVAIGRNIFQAPDPAAVARRLAAIVHAPCQRTANRPYEPIPPRQSGIGNPTLWHRGGLREDRLDRPAGQR